VIATRASNKCQFGKKMKSYSCAFFCALMAFTFAIFNEEFLCILTLGQNNLLVLGSSNIVNSYDYILK
jgi:hypothetical protein